MSTLTKNKKPNAFVRLTKHSEFTIGLVVIALFLLAPYLVGFYAMPQTTTDLALSVLQVNCVVTVLIWPSSFTLPNALRAAGGVPVVAHLFKYRFDDAQRTALLAAAADAGALGLEVRYTTYTPEQTAAAQALAGHFGLVPTGGSDYHGLRKPDIALGSGRGELCVPYAYLAGVKALAAPGRV